MVQCSKIKKFKAGEESVDCLARVEYTSTERGKSKL